MNRARLALVAVVALMVAACGAPSRPLQFIGGADLEYPPRARAAGIEGMVSVRYDVTMVGSVANAVVESAEPPGVFDAAALNLVRSWRFKPPVERGETVTAPGRVSVIRFRLGEGDAYRGLPVPRRP